jgi:hypothetical protein
MKRILPASAITRFLFLGTTLLASVLGRVEAQPPPPQPTPPVADIRLRVALQQVTCLDINDLAGNDEFYVLSAVASAFFSSGKDDYVWAQNIGNSPAKAMVTRPVKITAGQTRTYGDEGVIFDNMLPRDGQIIGGVRAYEQDETKDWNKRAEWIKSLDSANNIYRGAQGRITGSYFIDKVDKTWELIRGTARGDFGGLNPDDALGAAHIFSFNVQGPVNETIDWEIKTSDTRYVLRYQVTRTFPTPKPTPTPRLPATPVPTPTPEPTPAPVPYNLGVWVDEWDTTYGRVKLELQDNVLRGRLMQGAKEGERLELRRGTTTGSLVGTASYAGIVMQITMQISPDVESFTGTNSSGTSSNAWRGTRVKPGQKIPSPSTPDTGSGGDNDNTGNGSTNGGSSNGGTKTPSLPGGTIGGGYNPLKIFEVRVDDVQTGATEENLEVFCTIRNRSDKVQLFNGSVIRMAVTDADGIGVFYDYGMYPPSGPLTNIDGNKEMAPGAEMKVRFLFRMPESVAPLRTLSMWERYSQSKTVDISKVTWARSKPQADLSKFNLKSGSGDFQACGENLDVRFDGFRKARDGAYEAFFTFKNVARKATSTTRSNTHRPR